MDNNQKIAIKKENNDVLYIQTSNPLLEKTGRINTALSNYSQETPRPKFDKDSLEILNTIRFLNNLAPLKMPVYNFNIDEINGDYYYKPDKTPLLIREFDNDIIRDYYVDLDENKQAKSICRILEHDKNTGRLHAKIEPVLKNGSNLKTNITIFDEKINHKYTLFQISEDGTVCSLTEFTGKGKSFKTLFRNSQNYKVVRYLEGNENSETGYEMLDCILDANGSIVRIKRYNNKKEVCINYTDTKKNISVKTKE